MNTPHDCLVCFVKQSLDSARFCTPDPAIHEDIVRRACRMISEMDIERPSPEAARDIHRMIRERVGDGDPYLEGKREFNRELIERLPRLRETVEASDSPWETAIRISIAGNTIDFAFLDNLTDGAIDRAIEAALASPIYGEMAELDAAGHETAVEMGSDVERLREDVERAERILFLADNAGEIVCDRLWLEQFPLDRTTLAVKGGPILNDVLMEDAEAAGLTNMCRVIENGSDAPGTLLSECSDEFLAAYEAADLVIAKGLANFECLMEAPKEIHFLFKAKCDVIARLVGVPKNALVMRHNTVGKTQGLAE